jgi:hypothetical protein
MRRSRSAQLVPSRSWASNDTYSASVVTGGMISTPTPKKLEEALVGTLSSTGQYLATRSSHGFRHSLI